MKNNRSYAEIYSLEVECIGWNPTQAPPPDLVRAQINLREALDVMERTASDDHPNWDSWLGCAETMEHHIKEALYHLSGRTGGSDAD